MAGHGGGPTGHPLAGSVVTQNGYRYSAMVAVSASALVELAGVGVRAGKRPEVVRQRTEGMVGSWEANWSRTVVVMGCPPPKGTPKTIEFYSKSFNFFSKNWISQDFQFCLSLKRVT